jgi:hypothetical protein
MLNNFLESGNWGKWIIKFIIHPFIILGTPVFVLSLISILVYNSFVENINIGIRSFASVMFPIIIATFITIYQKDFIKNLEKIPSLVNAGVSSIVGFFVMDIVNNSKNFHLFSYPFISEPVPIIEFVLSGCFSILVFSYVNVEGNKMLCSYYGMISGFLLYIFLFGFPSIF